MHFTANARERCDKDRDGTHRTMEEPWMNYHNEISLISQYRKEIKLRTNGDIICFFLKKQNIFRRDLNNVSNCTQKALKRKMSFKTKLFNVIILAIIVYI